MDQIVDSTPGTGRIDANTLVAGDRRSTAPPESSGVQRYAGAW